jgi:diaminopimelate decarboxylase
MTQKTPHFLYNPTQLKTNYQNLESLAKKHLKNFIIAYSVKTNSYPLLLKDLLTEGSHFEVTSLNEINQTPKKQLIFNSPAKTLPELKLAIKNKFLINIDSLSELNKIHSLTQGKPISIGIRISLKEDKFGFSINQLPTLLKETKNKNIKIIALHFHSGTQQNLIQYQDFLKQANKITTNLETKLQIKYINLGGGLPDKQQLKNQNVNLEDYIKAIATIFQSQIQNNKKIILEPGRILTADTFQLITKVISIKNKNNKTYAILDAGINLLPKITLANYKFSKIKTKNHKDNTKQKKQTYQLSGPLLFGNDNLTNINESLKENDLIKVENVGAYCYNLAWEIIYKKPRIYVIKSS